MPHNPPYNHEMGDGVSAMGYHQGVRFSRAEFSQGMGVWTTWMNVPNPGTTGSSPDFSSGPIIPNSLFPIHVLGTSTTTAQTSPFGGNHVPTLDGSLTPPFSVDGHSHFPFLVADNADFGPPARSCGAATRGGLR